MIYKQRSATKILKEEEWAFFGTSKIVSKKKRIKQNLTKKIIFIICEELFLYERETLMELICIAALLIAN